MQSHFPAVFGSNLERRQFTLPGDLDGDLNVLVIAFQQWHQSLVNTWLPFLDQLEARFAAVRAYELPVISRRGRLAQSFIDGGMRAGIPDRRARERTITLYLDKEPFRQALGLPGEEEIYVLLVDRQGQVLWQAQGAFSAEMGESLAAAVATELSGAL
jgi:hypothetical protein